MWKAIEFWFDISDFLYRKKYFWSSCKNRQKPTSFAFALLVSQISCNFVYLYVSIFPILRQVFLPQSEWTRSHVMITSICFVLSSATSWFTYTEIYNSAELNCFIQSMFESFLFLKGKCTNHFKIKIFKWVLHFQTCDNNVIIKCFFLLMAVVGFLWPTTLLSLCWRLLDCFNFIVKLYEAFVSAYLWFNIEAVFLTFHFSNISVT